MSAASKSQNDEHETLKLATECAKQGRYEQAIEHLKTLLEANARHEIATGMLAGVYAELGIHERAIDYFKRVFDINPKNPLARFQLGLSQLNAKLPADALATLKPALDEHGEFLAHFHSAVALLQLNRPTDARTLLKEAERRMPKDHALYPQLQDMLVGIGAVKQ
jgi:tetratricopeptide (TPR) repeat protein